MRRVLVAFVLVPLALCLLPSRVAAQATDLIGLPIIEIHVEQEGRPVTDRLLLGLVETTAGQPLSMRDVRLTIDHLYGLGRYEDVQVVPEKAPGGVRVTYVLVPRHLVQLVEFRGTLGLDEEELRVAMTGRFGALPSAARAADVARALEGLYRERGYVSAKVVPQVRERHDPDRAILTFTIDAGPRATIRTVEVEGGQPDRLGLPSVAEVKPGQPYDSVAIQRRLQRYESDLRARGYYEARVTHTASFTDRREADVTIDVERGPFVRVALAGDPLPDGVRDDLVPVRREGSVDRDLLEDAGRAIEDYLKARGYRDATADFAFEQKGEELVITYTIKRGPQYVLDSVVLKGQSAMPQQELLDRIRVKTGEPFVQATVDTGVNAIRQAYTSRGFTLATVQPLVSLLPGPSTPGPATDRRVQLSLAIAEGPQTIVSSIVLTGNTVLTEGQIRTVMTARPGRPYFDVEVAGDRDRVALEYLNRGYQSVVVDPDVTLTDDNTRAEVRLAISEGPQVLVDHVIIVGNGRTSTATIEREVLLKPGLPLGYAARIESQQRLSALGLFRRVRITELRHGSEARRDVLVEVEEAPPTNVDYGGGVEVINRTRPTGPGGQAEEKFELAPRGFFQIGRRNLFGKNRSVTVFTRVSLRERDATEGGSVQQLGYGFNEYRFLATYREPKVFNTAADVVVTGIADQAIRTSFSFVTREARADMGLRLSPRYAVAGRYSYKHTRLFDQKFGEDDEQAPLIDRLFPQVGLSKFSASLFRDTRSDPLDPDSGTFMATENDFAARAVGSEVGFARTFAQALAFWRLPGQRRIVLAVAGRLGLAHGFSRAVPRLTPQGQPELGPDGVPIVDIVEDLPASERFFAGGDTTVRGFSLDRLGNERTITPSGFPTGGNGLVVLNAESRVGVWRALTVVGFLDAGNVYPRTRDIDLTDLRPAAGFGLRYRSPVGPIRIDLGFNLDRRELIPGRLERRTALHVSLGQAF